jgi:hypothetical protein
MRGKIIPFLTCFTSLLFLMACENEKFDKERWAEYEHLNGSDRTSMAEDLQQNHKLIGLSNKQMIQLLGPPENDPTETWYSLVEKYEFLDPDPVSGKNLIITFNKDSIITDAKIQKWPNK